MLNINLSKSCSKEDCFIRNNWFGASPTYPNNKEGFQKCVDCINAGLPKVTEIKALIRKIDWSVHA